MPAPESVLVATAVQTAPGASSVALSSRWIRPGTPTQVIKMFVLSAAIQRTNPRRRAIEGSLFLNAAGCPVIGRPLFRGHQREVTRGKRLRVAAHGEATVTGPRSHAQKLRIKAIMIMSRTVRAVKFLFVGPAVLVLLAIINAMTSPGYWWVKWAALGIGIAWILSLFRVIRAMIVVGGLVALIALLRNK